MQKIDVLEYALSKGYSATKDGQIIGVLGFPLKEAKTISGYKFFGVRFGSKSLNVSSHRFIAFYFGLKVNENECVRHKNAIKTDNRLENLEVGSVSDNFNDNDESWRQKFATAGAHTRRKLSDEDVLKIKSLMQDGKSISSISRDFNVAKTTVIQIRDGKSYKWIK